MPDFLPAKFLHDFEGFAENSFVFEHDVAVGHAGEVIAHGAVPAGRADLFARLFADFLRVLQVMIKKVFQHLLRAAVRLVDGGVVIKIFVEIVAQFAIQLTSRRAVLDQRSGEAAHVVGGMDFCIADKPFAVFNDVADFIR